MDKSHITSASEVGPLWVWWYCQRYPSHYVTLLASVNAEGSIEGLLRTIVSRQVQPSRHLASSARQLWQQNKIRTRWSNNRCTVHVQYSREPLLFLTFFSSHFKGSYTNHDKGAVRLAEVNLMSNLHHKVVQGEVEASQVVEFLIQVYYHCPWVQSCVHLHLRLCLESTFWCLPKRNILMGPSALGVFWLT